VRINNMSNLLIGDASVAGANITIEDGSGLSSTGINDNYCLFLNNVSDVTVDNLDLTATTYGYQGWGVVVTNSSADKNVIVRNCKINNRYSGIYCNGGRDYTILNNDLKITGSDATRPSLWFRNVLEGSIPKGVSASGNTFGSAAGFTRTAVRIDGINNLLIGDASVAGANIILEDNSGLTNAATHDDQVIFLANVSNTTVDNLELSSTIGYQGRGIYFANSAENSNNTVKNCKINTRYMGIYCAGGKDYTILNNDLKGTGNDLTRPAIYLLGVKPGVIASGVAASGNLFGTGTSRTAIRVENMDGLLIGDAGVAGANVVLEDNSGANNMSTDGDHQAVIYLTNASNITVDNVDVSRTAAGRDGMGIRVDNNAINNSIVIQNCKVQQRHVGVYVSGGTDVTIKDNDLRYSGFYHDLPALFLSSIAAGALPGGVSISGNLFGGSSNGAIAHSGIQLANMRDLVISDGVLPGTNVKLEDNSGLNEIIGDEVNSRGVLYLNNVRNVQVKSVDLSKATGSQANSFALLVLNSINVNIDNNLGSNRRRGFYLNGGHDITVTNNDLTKSGADSGTPALYFDGITPGTTLPAGVAASGNTFGGVGALTGVRVDNMRDLLIGDVSVVGANIVVEDASGLNNMTTITGNSNNPPIYLTRVQNITVDNIDASRASGQDEGGIIVAYSLINSNITIKNCNFNRHRRAIYCSGGQDYTIKDNTLLNSGSGSDQPAIYMQNIQGRSLTGGVLMSGNTFGGTSSFSGVRFENMRDLYIGDAATGTNVKIEDNSGISNMAGNGSASGFHVLALTNVMNSTIDNVDVSRPVGSTQPQDFTGIRIDNGAAHGPITIKNCDIRRHRTGIYVNGGKDYTITSNDLRGCGVGNNGNEPALFLGDITQVDGTVPMGILANNNLFGTANSITSNAGVTINNMCGIRISDGTMANTHITLESNSGIKDVTGSSPAVLTFNNGSGISVEKINMDFTGTQTGYGIRFNNSSASQFGNVVKDNSIKNHRMALSILNGADYTVTGNNFQLCGVTDDEPAVRMDHVAEGALYGGINMSNNTFGGTGAAFGLKFLNMSNLKISDGTLSGTNINLGAANVNGLYNVSTGYVLHLSGVCNSTISTSDFSRTSLTRQGTGVRMNNCLGNTIEKVLVGNRDKGIEVLNGSENQNFTCNTLFDNNFGFDISSTLTGTNTIENNIMDCNGSGLRMATGSVIATNNYWGTSNGSTTSGGSGDTYTGTVIATPFLAAAPGCAQAPPDLETKGNSVEIVDGDTTPTFDDHTQYCAVTNQTQTRTYTLKNTGNGIMNLTGTNPVTLTLGGAPFTVATQPSDVELLPGETTTFTVQFAPIALGASTATLNVASRDCRENPYNFAIKGQGCVDIQGTISGTQAVCTGQSANLTVNISAGLAPFMVMLSDGSTFTVNNIGNNTVTVNPTTITIYTITKIIDANGCCSTNNGSATVTVNPLPTPSIGVTETSGNSNGDGILCQGANALLDAGVYSAYLWSTSASTQTITVGTSGTFTVQVTDANGCTAVASRVITVNTNPTPTITETDNSGTPNDNILCAGGSAALNAGAYTAYLWTGGSVMQTLNVTTAGTYTVQVTDANGCTATADQAISVNALPAATLSGTFLVCPGTTTALIDLNITAGVAPFTVVLSDNSSHNVAATGMSPLNVTVAGPATNSFTITSITSAGGCLGSGSGTATVDFGSAGEIEISGNGNAIIDGDMAPALSDHTDFGNVLIGGNFTRTFTITNSHPTLPLTVSSVNIVGSAAFTLMTAPAGSVAANGGTTTFVVKFTPSATGLASATVNVNSSDCNEQPYDFAVQGTATCTAKSLDECGHHGHKYLCTVGDLFIYGDGCR